MSERILKFSISTMEAFNKIRNEESLAHDNPTLNYDEGLLIFNHVCSANHSVHQGTRSTGRACVAASACQQAIDDEIPF